MFTKIKENKDKALAIVVGSASALPLVGITSTNGVIAFEQADKDAIGVGFTNAISNLWAGFTTVLPYIGMAVGVVLVIGLAFRLIFRRS